MPRISCRNMALLRDASVGWQAIRKPVPPPRFRGKKGLAPRFGDQGAGLFDVERLDHPAFVALGAAGRGGDQAVRGIELGFGWGEGEIDRRNLVGMDHRLAVESELPALLAFGDEVLIGVQAVEDAVEDGDT